MKLIIVLFTIFSVNCLIEDKEWDAFKKKYKRDFQNETDESLHYSLFAKNFKKVVKHNERFKAGKETYKMCINKFSDMTEDEKKNWLGYKPQITAFTNNNTESGVTIPLVVPDAVDWREMGAAFKVKTQSCGNSWAFSATGALESQNHIFYNKSIYLSEQELTDCSIFYGNGGCDGGGNMDNAFEYVKNAGLESEADYKNTNEGHCAADIFKSVVRVKEYKNVLNTDKALKEVVAAVGPIAVAIHGSLFFDYCGGIFNDSSCPNGLPHLNHAMLAVGYGVKDDQPYWIVKNSWGVDWGEQGYIRIARDVNMCGIVQRATVTIIS